MAFGSVSANAQVAIDKTNWGRIIAPVFGTSEPGVYAGAELFAGPRKFDGQYFNGVLPNGRIVQPAGISVQVGMDPLGIALTPDGKYLITSNDDERNSGYGAPPPSSLQAPINRGGYSISVIATATMLVVSQIQSGPVYRGLQVTGSGPYTLWASGGAANAIRLFTISAEGVLTPDTPAAIPIPPLLPANAGYVSHYTPGVALRTPDGAGALPPVPTNFDRAKGAQITFPAGSALSPDGRFLYVVCNGDNSLAVIDTRSKAVVKQIPVGYFPYDVSVSRDGSKILVSNWGIEEYKFTKPTYDPATGALTAIGATDTNLPEGFYVPHTDTKGAAPKTSSISILSASGGDGQSIAPLGAIYEGLPLDALQQVGDTHPSATAIVRKNSLEVLYVTKSNSDSLGLIRLDTNRRLHDFDLSLVQVRLPDGHKVHGAYPNALAVSPDNSRLYVAEAGINSVAVLDTSDPTQPRLLGRIPTGWYPTALAISQDGNTLYILNAKGVGEDINPHTDLTRVPHATGVESFADSNFLFGSVQKLDLTHITPDNTSVQANNFAVLINDLDLANDFTVHDPTDTRIVPIGGKPSVRIKHVFFILHENKSFDSMLGNLSDHLGPFAGTTFVNPDGSVFQDQQFTGVSLNTQQLARTFATAVNYYSDSEESDAGHQFCASGTASDYTEKTILVKNGRGLLVNKNMEPEDYPEGGYLFNNAARHGISFKDYGDLIRIVGSDTGDSTPTKLNDPRSGNAGYPQLQADNKNLAMPLVNKGDVDSPTQGLGQSYFLALPDLAVLGMNNKNGEPHLDRNYPGYNFNISDQRRAQEFIHDFDRMVAKGTLPQFLHIYQPNDHTRSVVAPNKNAVFSTGMQQVADADVALGMVVQHIMQSKIYYDPATGEGSAIFVTYDDAQSCKDHIHPHRTPLLAISPYIKPGYLGKQHYVSASIVKTEELLLGLPPNNYGDLFATDLRDLFQPDYNGIKASALTFTRTVRYTPSPEGRRLWALVKYLDTSAPDRDSERLGILARLSHRADQLYQSAAQRHHLHTRLYHAEQARLYRLAAHLIHVIAPRDADG